MVFLIGLTAVLYLGGIVLFFFRMKSAARRLDAQCETTITTALTLVLIIPFGLGLAGGAMIFGSQTGATTVAVMTATSFSAGLFLIPGAIRSGIDRLVAREKEECNERFNQLMRQRVEERKARAAAKESSNKPVHPSVNISR